MGGKDSKFAYLTYEDAVKRVSDTELKRLKDAFKRSATLNGFLSKQVFMREVLGDTVPAKLAEQMFRVCGGTSKGLAFKELINGLVVITRGRRDEKVKFIYALYANSESLSHVQKVEMDNLVLETEGQVPHALSQLFLENDKVSFDKFRPWILNNTDATSVSKWLLRDRCTITLSNDNETPTFYQTLAGVTHLEESDITELEKRYWVLKGQSGTGQFDMQTFQPIIGPPVPESLVKGVFNAFDENRDNHIDFKEMACGISACCRGPQAERQKFCFKVFDMDHDGLLNKSELVNMIKALVKIRKENLNANQLARDKLHKLDPDKVVEEILEKYDSDEDGCITQEEYLVWTVDHPLPSEFLTLLFQVCHICLGLKPENKEQEGSIVRGWLERELRRGLQVGSTWFLVSNTWYKTWLDYVLFKPSAIYPVHNGIGSPPPTPRSSTLPRHSSPTQKSSTLPRGTSPKFKTTGALRGSKDDSVPSGKGDGGIVMTRNTRIGSAGDAPIEGSTIINGSPRRSATPDITPQRPAAIDNTQLVVPNTSKIMILTNEGGRLKPTLVQDKDFQIMPQAVWDALSSWYGGAPSMPRTVIQDMNKKTEPKLELYPIQVKFLRHQTQQQRAPNATTSFTGMMAGIGGIAIGAGSSFPTQTVTTPRRYIAYTASFSCQHSLKQIFDFMCTRIRVNRDDLRLWKFKDEQNMHLLEDEEATVEELGLEDYCQVLAEVRNKDLTWPEEMNQLAKNKADQKQEAPPEKGATGLNNLGNTCFMNSAVQCVSNTKALTTYFTAGMHRFELNRDNPLGMKGHVAQRYGDLIKDIWSGTVKTIAPLKLRWTIAKYAPRFNGFQQHDSQELLGFLLDGLHEDLNRVHEKPYVELRDSEGRPDELVAREAWDNHVLRNQSIVVDLFHGQLKSEVKCRECSHVSVRFDPFTYLSLPLPMESCLHLEIVITRLDGSTPVKYGLRLNMDEKYKELKKQLSVLSEIPSNQLLLCEVSAAMVKSFPQDTQKIKGLLGGSLCAYELPPPSAIPTLSAEEEKGLQLGDIQRMTNKGIPNTSCTSCTADHKSQGSTHNPAHIHSSPASNSNCSNSTHNGVQSKGLHPNGTAGHSRNASTASTSCNSTSCGGTSCNGTPCNGNNNETTLGGDFIIAVNRKIIRMDTYFLSSQKTRPSLFGQPLILPCDDSMTQQKLYSHVWMQVSRLVSPLPPSETLAHNHAQDCDDSLGYEYPFTLKVVQKDGVSCAWCPWYQFCRGCKIECSPEKFSHSSLYVAIDWEPTALHLRYQSAAERIYTDHESVAKSRHLQSQPINLDTCLQSFTREEVLGEDEMWYCSKCKAHRVALKKMQIWKLPPILIIHLKRFQFLNTKWVKSQKIVKFPINDFDPTNYIASRQLHRNVPHNTSAVSESTTSAAADSKSHLPQTKDSLDTSQSKANTPQTDPSEAPSKSDPTMLNSKSNKTQATNHDRIADSTSAPKLRDSGKLRRQRHESVDSGDYANVRYNLYALSCHHGILGGGHYIAYGKNPKNKWFMYNDSSCKEVKPEDIDTDSAYMLFYERAGLDITRFMPNVDGKEPDLTEIDDEFESEFKKMCVIQ
ncbi:unnamed protein product [Owenia fusiformis]|uniref:Ubiquitin carboxyl-terminal hydrolase 32 n=1 Tax=Owenia fusiformis TaxID=6347 RepID=A0A8J1XPG3_OWEFU|nr:unnamed protein product [Owenia fusiformis]